MRNLFTLLWLALFMPCKAQVTFMKEFRYFDLYAIAVEPEYDGGYMIFAKPGCAWCGTLIRTDSLADTIWTRDFYWFQGSPAGAGALTTDSGVIVAGLNLGYMTKFNLKGDTLWTKNFTAGNAFVNSIQAGNGGFVFIGSADATPSPTPVAGNAYFVKANNFGDTLSTRIYDLPDPAMATCIRKTADGGFVISGWYSIPPFGAGMLMIKLDANGDTLWTRSFEGDSLNIYLYGSAVYQSSDGGYLLTGKRTTPTIEDTYCIRTDSLGGMLWSKSYRVGNSNSLGYAVEQTTDGGYMITGVAGNATQSYMMKIDSLGHPTWTKAYYSINAYFEDVAGAKPLPGGDYVYASSMTDTTTGFGYDAVLLIRTDSAGNTGCGLTSLSCIEIPSSVVASQPVMTIHSTGWPYSSASCSFNQFNLTDTSFCLSTGIHEPEEMELKIYPNPSYGRAEIHSGQQVTSIEIYNTIGQVVMRKEFDKVSGTIPLDIADLPNGLYFVRISAGEFTVVRKITKL